MPPGSGVPVPGACAGSSTSMSTETYSLSALARASLDRVAHHVLEAAFPDLLHGVPRHALFLHPLEGVLRRPVAAQTDLDEVGAGHRARLDQPAHRRAVAGQVALDLVGGVGVRVEVHDADVAVAVHVGDRGRGGPGDRVVAAEDRPARCRATRWRAPARGCCCARPRSGRAGSTRRRSRRPRASRRSRVPDPCDRCRARRRWPESRAGRTARRAGWWSPTSNGAPTIATSGRHESSCSTSVRKGRCPNDASPRRPVRAARPSPAEVSRSMIVIVAHALDRTVAWLNRDAVTGLTLNRSERFAQRPGSGAWPSPRWTTTT